jgi:hypothetical protein
MRGQLDKCHEEEKGEMYYYYIIELQMGFTW